MVLRRVPGKRLATKVSTFLLVLLAGASEIAIQQKQALTNLFFAAAK
jgi:hypothetical protein